MVEIDRERNGPVFEYVLKLWVEGKDGKLIVLNKAGKLFIADASPTGFTPISQCDVLEAKKTGRTFYTPPVLCNGRIYCRSYAGELICIDVSK